MARRNTTGRSPLQGLHRIHPEQSIPFSNSIVCEILPGHLISNLLGAAATSHRRKFLRKSSGVRLSIRSSHSNSKSSRERAFIMCPKSTPWEKSAPEQPMRGGSNLGGREFQDHEQDSIAGSIDVGSISTATACQATTEKFGRRSQFQHHQFRRHKFPNLPSNFMVTVAPAHVATPFRRNFVVLQLPSDTESINFHHFTLLPFLHSLWIPPRSPGSVSLLCSSKHAFHDYFLHSHTTSIPRCTRTDEFICDRPDIASVNCFSSSGPPQHVGGVENVPS